VIARNDPVVSMLNVAARVRSTIASASATADTAGREVRSAEAPALAMERRNRRRPVREGSEPGEPERCSGDAALFPDGRFSFICSAGFYYLSGGFARADGILPRSRIRQMISAPEIAQIWPKTEPEQHFRKVRPSILNESCMIA
jgi:hypothetical protein